MNEVKKISIARRLFAVLVGVLTFIFLCFVLGVFKAATGFDFSYLGALLGTAAFACFTWGSFFLSRGAYRKVAGISLPNGPKRSDDWLAVLAEFSDLKNKSAAFRAIASDVEIEMRKSKEAIVAEIKKGAILPIDVVYQFGTNIAGDQLQAGMHHIYRGTLTEVGKLLSAFYTEGWMRNVAGGFSTKEKADVEIAAMGRIIRDIG